MYICLMDEMYSGRECTLYAVPYLLCLNSDDCEYIQPICQSNTLFPSKLTMDQTTCIGRNSVKLIGGRWSRVLLDQCTVPK